MTTLTTVVNPSKPVQALKPEPKHMDLEKPEPASTIRAPSSYAPGSASISTSTTRSTTPSPFSTS